LTIFVSPKVNQNKLKLLDYSAVIKSHTPVSDAFKYAKDTNSFYLRQSTDPIAQKAYSIVGEEINSQLPTCTSIFLPVGSGSTLVGIAQKLAPQIKIFSVQPASHAPISSKFDHNFTPEIISITDALSVKYLPLKSKVVQSIISSNGSGLVIQDDQVILAHKWLKDHDINTSPEGALALAGFYKAQQTGLDVGDCPLIILTGTNRE
jgi:threonine dehydratase